MAILASFECYQSPKNKKWYWRLKAGNGEILCNSQGYESERGAKVGIASTKLNAPLAKYERVSK